MKNQKLKLTLISMFTLYVSAFAQVSSVGLIGSYQFSGNADDLSGNNFHGTVNGASLTSDRFGNPNSAYLFDGISNTIFLSSEFDVLPRTISFWFNATNINTTLGFVYCSDNPGLTNGLTNFGVVNDNGIDSWWSTVSIVTRFAPITVNNWHHGVIVVDSNATYKYIDGQLIFSDSLSTYFSSAAGLTNTVIGANRFATGEFFEGSIDDIRIYNRALQPCEIPLLYNEGICFETITVTDTLIINANLTGFSPIVYQNSIKIYPNPSNDHITIDCGSNYNTLAGYSMRIDNSIGQTVYSTSITQQSYYIDLNTWSGNGLYLVYLLDSSNQVVDVRKIVIQ